MTEPVPPSNGAEPSPSVRFTDLGLIEPVLRAVTERGFTHPTPIQEKAIPWILQGRDLIGCAQTGTGKTAAFALPMLHRLSQYPSRGHVRALILEPTRELALQVMEEARSLAKHVPLKGISVFGGSPMDLQTRAIEKGVDFISATPGRLLDHIYSGHIDFVDITLCVLDEVDRMLDMGFLPDVQRILQMLPEKRQNLVFSATLPPEIERLCRQVLHDPVLIQVGGRSTPATGVRQAAYLVSHNRKTDLLLRLLSHEGMTSVLIFTRTKIEADRLARTLHAKELKVAVIHGDRSQGQRLSALESFRSGRSPILVATDIAARGIDIRDISHVINYHVPRTAEEYVHRIGRTARAAATGDAITLVDRKEEPLLAEIEQNLGITISREKLPDFDYGAPPADDESHGKRSGHPRGRARRGGGASHHGGARPHGGGHPHGGSSHGGSHSKGKHGPGSQL